MLDVLIHLAAIQRLQVITHRDALAQLPQFMFVQAIAQLRLAHQNNLQQLAVVGLEIREQPDLFEHGFVQILRFIDDQHRLFALLDLAQQKFVEDRERIEPIQIQPLHRQTEFRGDRLHELVGVQRGIQNQRRGVRAIELLEHRAAQRGFARADFAGELDETLALANAVKQMVQRFAMLRTVKQEPTAGSA